MGSIYPRGRKLWLRYKGTDGAWTGDATPYHVGQEALAKKLLAQVEARIESGAESDDPLEGAVTVKRFATKVFLPEREKFGLSDVKNTAGRLRRYVYARIGPMKLADVRPRHINDVIKGARQTGKAPRSIRNIYSDMSALFREARIAGLIEQSPCILTSRQLGVVEDADPEWRATAIFTRDELALFLFDARLRTDQHVWYGLQGLAGLRPGEAAPLCWRHYEPTLEPLGRLLITRSNSRRRTKTGVVRHVPVHPALAMLLAEWRMSGWVKLMGRAAGPDDLIVPLPATRYGKLGAMRNKNTWGHETRAVLVALELRRRRGYDLRRTFISLARSDGARRDLLKVVTHGADNVRDMMDLYSTFEWKVVCDEVSKLRIAPPAARPAGFATALATVDPDPVALPILAEFRRRDSNSKQRHFLTR